MALNESNLHDYQWTAVNHVMKNRFCALFLEMGLGKTVSTLTAVNKLMFEELDISRVLVVAPKRVAEHVWSTEVKKWDHLKHLKISVVSGSVKQRIEKLNAKAEIFVIGRDNIAWLCGLYGGSRLPFDTLVLDELSSFKNPKSIRFKALRLVQPCFRRIIGLTGTPAPNTLIDLWSQIYLLDRGERLGKYITKFRGEFFTKDYNGFSYTARKHTEKEIHKRISDICMSMSSKDYLKMKEPIINDIKLIFDDKLQKKYNDFEKEQVLQLFEDQPEDQGINAVNAAALSNKLLQFANGAVYDEQKNFHEVHDLKIEAIKEIVEDANGKPVLIAWTYRHDRERLHRALKKYKPRDLKHNNDIDDWNAGKIRVLMMHPASGGHGLNLQAGGNIIVWFGQNWSLELYQQLNARLARQGQEFVVVINRLIASKTIDEDVIKALMRKDKTQKGLMDAVKARVNKYVQNYS